MTTVRVAFVGAGAMAREHSRAFGAIEGVELVGIHSRTRTTAQALADDFDIPAVCDTVDALYTTTKADLVIVAVSDEVSHDVGLTCMAYPWVILMEKPPGIAPIQTAALQAAAQQKHRRVFVGLNRRFYSVTMAALQDLEGCAGPRYIHVQDQQNMGAMRAKGFPEVVIENWMYKNSIHLVDYLRVFGRGAITQVTPLMPWQGATTELLLAKVAFDSGDVGLYEARWQGPGPWAVAISTRERRWELRPLEQASYQNAGERQRHTVTVGAWDHTFKPGFRLQAQSVINALRGGTGTPPTLADANATMQLVAQLYS